MKYKSVLQFKVGEYGLAKIGDGIKNPDGLIEQGWRVVRFTFVGESSPYTHITYDILNEFSSIEESIHEDDYNEIATYLKPISKKEAIHLLF